MCSAYEQVENVQELLRSLRKNVERVHNSWWSLVTAMSDKVDVAETMRRVCRRQTACTDVSGANPCKYFKSSAMIPVPLLNELLGHLSCRFGLLQKLLKVLNCSLRFF